MSRIVGVAKRKAQCALEVLGMRQRVVRRVAGVVSRIVGVAKRKTTELWSASYERIGKCSVLWTCLECSKEL